MIKIPLVLEDDIDLKTNRYVVFTRRDFEEVLSDIGEFESIDESEFEKYGIDEDTKEIVYLIKIKNEHRYFLIYSSIEGNVDRPCGKDAIRACPILKYEEEEGRYLYGKRGRINRTENWRKTLKERMEVT